eukprot:scaffold2682_cov344-Pavlova_lutheri.AAC.16
MERNFQFTTPKKREFQSADSRRPSPFYPPHRCMDGSIPPRKTWSPLRSVQGAKPFTYADQSYTATLPADPPPLLFSLLNVNFIPPTYHRAGGPACVPLSMPTAPFLPHPKYQGRVPSSLFLRPDAHRQACRAEPSLPPFHGPRAPVRPTHPVHQRGPGSTARTSGVRGRACASFHCRSYR